MESVSYLLEPSKRSILAEIYFPKKTAYQGAVYQALESGLKEEGVRATLVTNAEALYKTEFALSSPHRFDPDRYTMPIPQRREFTKEEVERRMGMYTSPFFGWSMYEVDGVFVNEGKIAEERVQIIRLIFKFERKDIEAQAKETQYYEVYRAMIYWAMSAYGHVDNYFLWSDDEKDRFLARHTWTGDERRLAEQHFRTIVSALGKWMDDIALFIFGYLVRAFWQQVRSIPGGKLEDEIWVASVFHVNVNVVRPGHPIESSRPE